MAPQRRLGTIIPSNGNFVLVLLPVHGRYVNHPMRRSMLLEIRNESYLSISNTYERQETHHHGSRMFGGEICHPHDASTLCARLTGCATYISHSKVEQENDGRIRFAANVGLEVRIG